MPEREQHVPKPFGDWTISDLAISYAAAREAEELHATAVGPLALLVKAEIRRRIERHNAAVEFVKEGGTG